MNDITDPEVISEEEGKQEVAEIKETEESIDLDQDQSKETPELDESEESETVVLIGDEEPEQTEEAPQWIKDVRKQNREQAKEIKRLNKQLQSDTVEIINAPGEKPKLEDFDFDPEEYESAYNEWVDKKNKYDIDLITKKTRKEDEEKSFQEKVKSYQKQKSELAFDDVEEAEQLVYDLMDVRQIGSIVTYAKTPALVLYALGKNPKKTKELSEINDPVKFAIAVADLEKKLTVTQRKPGTKPERILSGSGPVMNAGDKELTRLRTEAEKTGNYTKVREYRDKQKK